MSMDAIGRSQQRTNAAYYQAPHRRCTDSYKEMEVYLRRTEDELSRSFHELVNARGDTRRNSTTYYDAGRAQVSTSQYFIRPPRFLPPARRNDATANGGYLKRRKLQRRQSRQRSDTPTELGRSTPALFLPVSESDEEEEPCIRPPTVKARLPARYRKYRKRPPAVMADKARSVSVRDLPTTSTGERLDFSNPDSVTRWTSQILAELDSLPTSSWETATAASRSCTTLLPSALPFDRRATPTTARSAQRRLEQVCSELIDVSSWASMVNMPTSAADRDADDDGSRTPTPPLTTTCSSSSSSDGDNDTPLPSPPVGRRKPARPIRLAGKSKSLGADSFPSSADVFFPRRRQVENPLPSVSTGAAAPSPAVRDDVSVRRVIASIIRHAEERQPTVDQTDSQPALSPQIASSTEEDVRKVSVQQDSCTQTSPFLSRSSSFTWLSDPEAEEHGRRPPTHPSAARADSDSDGGSSTSASEPELAMDATVRARRKTSLNSPHLSDASAGDAVESSDENGTMENGLFRAGEKLKRREQQQHQQSFATPHSAFVPVATTVAVHPPKKNAVADEFDESLRLLLECTSSIGSASSATALNHRFPTLSGSQRGSIDGPTPTSTRPPPLDNHAAGVVRNCDKVRTSLRNRYDECAPPESQATGKPPSMNESTYDNVPKSQRRWLASRGLLQPTVDIWNSSDDFEPRPAAEPPASPIDSSPKLPTTPSYFPRDFSVCSGLLADTESSPLSPDQLSFADRLRQTQAVRMGASARRAPAKAVVREQGITASTPDTSKYFLTDVVRADEIRFVKANGEISNEYPLFSKTIGGSADNVMSRSDVIPAVRHQPPPPPSPHKTSASSGGMLAGSMPTLIDNARFGVASMSRLTGSGSRLAQAYDGTTTGIGEFTSEKERAEAEALEICQWLRATGFPQYAQMYQEQQFPIDVRSVARDHEFLEQDSLEALFRRLHKLNRCAIMKVDSVVLRRNPADDESDEENTVALSRRWRYQRKSQTWSRVGDDLPSSDMPTAAAVNSPAAKVNMELPRRSGSPMPPSYTPRHAIGGGKQRTVLPGALIHEEAAGVSHQRLMSEESNALTVPIDTGRLQRSQSERIKDRAKAFVRRIDIRSSSRRRKGDMLPPSAFARKELVIGSPVLVSHHSASPANLRMLKDGVTRTPEMNGRRYGTVFATPVTSPSAEQSTFDEQQLQKYVDDNSNYRQSMDEQQCSQTLTATSAIPLVLFNRSYSSPHSRRSLAAAKNEDGSSPEMPNRSTSSTVDRRLNVDNGGQTASATAATAASGTKQSHSSLDSSDTDSPRFEPAERRDSGVGSSLSRSPSGPHRGHNTTTTATNQQHRWQPAEADDAQRPMDSLPLAELTTLRKLALLKLTALMERHSPQFRPLALSAGSQGGRNWSVQKLLRKITNPAEQKALKERLVFGIPLSSIAQKTGLPLPQCILHAVRFLRQQAPEAVGIFRKSGVQSRIKELKRLCELNPAMSSFTANQTYDVADMLKQFFRELPEPLLTSKLSETFIGIQLYVPSDLRLDAMRHAVLLLPDENREALQTLLAFLRDVSWYSDTNQMTAQNLSVCFAPSLFQLSGRLMALSPQRRHKTISGTSAGMPNEKELRENAAAQSCLTCMINDCNLLFKVPPTIRERYEATLADDVVNASKPMLLSELGTPRGNYRTYLEDCARALLKEQQDRWKGWLAEGSSDGVEIWSRKAPTECSPLKLWRCCADGVEAPPTEVLQRLACERDVWDDRLLKGRCIGRLGDACDLFQYVLNDMPPHPTRDFCVVRMWKCDVGELRGGCLLVETSVSVPDYEPMGGVVGLCLAGRFLIEPSGAGRSRITYVARTDFRGRGKQWYNKIFGHICARQVAQLRDSFRHDQTVSGEGPETKI